MRRECRRDGVGWRRVRAVRRAALRLKAPGVSALGLGTLDNEGAPGLARVKLETGARVVPPGQTMLFWPRIARSRRAAA